jgi:2-dehydropantoate 2-reductase
VPAQSAVNNNKQRNITDCLNGQGIVIAGAGAIGSYLGIQLHKAGFRVAFLGSERVVQAVHRSGLVLEYPDATAPDSFGAGELAFTTDTGCCADAGLVIVTAKSQVTATLSRQIRPYTPADTPLLTLQNGITNAAALRELFPNNPVLAGMVTFNVIERESSDGAPAVFRLTTRGDIYLQQHTPSLAPVFERANCRVKERGDIEAALWSKLLLNLVNPLDALSGLPLKANLADRAFRLRWAACMREGLAVLKAAGIKPSRVAPLPPALLPVMVSLPNAVYLKLAKRMVDMDPTAKSSMAQDLARGRPTEIEFLSGALIRLGRRVGVATPENERVYAAVKSAESLQSSQR